MNSIEFIDIDNLHHAYLIEGGASQLAEIQLYVRGNKVTEEVYTREFDTFGIDDSRELMQLARMNSFGRQLFFYQVTLFTTEAQNALLKLFEEPPPHTHFFFCVPNIEDILVTLRSRVREVPRVVATSENSTDSGMQFVHGHLVQRMEHIASIVEAKDKVAAMSLLQSIEDYLSQYKKQKQVRDALIHIFAVRRTLNQSGASIKILLESVALLTPLKVTKK